MPENSGSDHVSVGLETVEEGDKFVAQINAPVLEASTDVLISESLEDVPSNDGGGSEATIERGAMAEMVDSVDQEPNSPHVDHNSDMVLVSGPVSQSCSGDIKASEDAGREDMFLDACEELSYYDMRSPDSTMRTAFAGNQYSSEKRREVQDNLFTGTVNEGQNHYMVDKVQHLRALLEKTLAEKAILVQQNKEENERLEKEISYLHCRCEVLSREHMLHGENDSGFSDHHVEANTLVHETPLHDMISECSKFLESVMKKRLLDEGMMEELYASLRMKDQEIQDLNAKVMELSMSRDIVASYMNSTQSNWLHSVKLSSEIQSEKDQLVDAIVNRMLTSIATVVNQEEPVDDSIAGKISHIERGNYMLIENYNFLLSQINQLKQLWSGPEAKVGLQLHEEFGMICIAAHDELLELRRRQTYFEENLRHLEDENKKLIIDLDKQKEILGMANAELGRANMELEKEKTKCSNAKEKLSLAVTKGKALVQQRDSLRQSLAETTSHLDRSLLELQEKASSLEAAELSKEELVQCKNLILTLQEALSEKESHLENIGENLSLCDMHEELQNMDLKERVRWLVGERVALKAVSLEYQKLRDALLSIDLDLPGKVSSLDLESRVVWIQESFHQVKAEMINLEDEFSRMKDAACHEIDRLTVSLSTEIQERAYIQMELDDLASKYEIVVWKECQASLEKDHILSKLLEVSRITSHDQGFHDPSADMGMLLDKILDRMEEQNKVSFASYDADVESFGTILTSLFVTTQELMICEKMLEDEMIDRFETNKLSNKYRAISEELITLKGEKDSLQKDLERSEEKSALLREKLSMAVKKGKGLVQEREKLQNLLEEKNSEIENLKHELQLKDFALGACRDQISNMSAELEHIPKLEADLAAVKEEREQLEKLLSENNHKVQGLIELVDGTIPVDSVFEDPVEKIKWLADNFIKCQAGKAHAQQELLKVKEEVSALAGKLLDAEAMVKSVENALSIAENNIFRLLGEKKELNFGKTSLEHKLNETMDEIDAQERKFKEASETRRSLEDALSVAESNLCVLINEKEDAQVNRVATQAELEKVKEANAAQRAKLADANETIQMLEKTLSQVEANVSLLTEENITVQVSRIHLENEVNELKEEIKTQAGNLMGACTSIKSLEGALLEAENNISALVDEKKIAEEEISVLNLKLSTCMEELSGTVGRLDGRSKELIDLVNNFHFLLNDKSVFLLVREKFEKNFRTMKEVDLILINIRDQLMDMGLEGLEIHHAIEGNSYETVTFSDTFDNLVPKETSNGEADAVDDHDIFSHFRMIMDGLHLKNKLLSDKFEGLFSSMEGFMIALLQKLQAVWDQAVVTGKNVKTLKHNLHNMQVLIEAQNDKIGILDIEIAGLVSACTDAASELELEVDKNVLELKSLPKLEELDHSLSSTGGEVGTYAARNDDKYIIKTIEKLLSASKKARLIMRESKVTLESAIEERETSQNRVSMLESDVKALQELCSDLKFQLEDHQVKEVKFEEREAELCSSNSNLLLKEQDAEGLLLSASDAKILLDKIRGIDVPFGLLEIRSPEAPNPFHLKKLYFIIDNFTELQYKVNLLSHDKEEIQSNLDEKLLEIEYLKEEVCKLTQNKQDSESLKNELSALSVGLQKIIIKLGGNDAVRDQNSAGVNELLTILTKLAASLILDSESSKSEAQELGSKLIGSQKVVDDLLTRIKVLEETIQGRESPSPETVQERRIFEAPSRPTNMDVSEIEDLGSLGKSTLSPVPSAAHVRVARKGSTDHLVLNIDSESHRLINEGTDEEKGHVFKSLNTTGLIPKQGKMIADRVDGIWVSGGRALISRPRARLGLIAYWIFLHIWLLGSIL